MCNPALLEKTGYQEDLRTENAELRRQLEAVTGALYRLEAACEQHCSVLSVEAYNAAMECEGMGDALQYLDQCRTEARAALGRPEAEALTDKIQTLLNRHGVIAI